MRSIIGPDRRRWIGFDLIIIAAALGKFAATTYLHSTHKDRGLAVPTRNKVSRVPQRCLLGTGDTNHGPRLAERASRVMRS